MTFFCQRCDHAFKAPAIRALCDPCQIAAIRYDRRPRALGRDVKARAREFGQQFGQALAEAMTEEVGV